MAWAKMSLIKAQNIMPVNINSIVLFEWTSTTDYGNTVYSLIPLCGSSQEVGQSLVKRDHVFDLFSCSWRPGIQRKLTQLK